MSGLAVHPKHHKKAAVIAAAPDGLFPFTTVTGKVYMSEDGIGTNDPAGGPVYVQKNDSSATVQAAYLLAAGIPGYVMQNGDVTLDGTSLSFAPADNVLGNFGVNSVWTDVTSIVKPVVDAAAPGNIQFTAAEPLNTTSIDGEILAVIMNDPTLPTDNTVSFLFGALDTAGDNFAIGLANPLNLSDPNLALTMSIGDSYGYQGPPATGQYSTIAVNGTLMTSSAGGNDDSICKYDTPQDFATCGNGELITVGGIGDSTANPPDPTATDSTCAPPGPPRCDDELYNLLPFVHNGDTSIQVNTTNPSNNDNIFFTGFQLDSAAAVVGCGAVLTPVSGSNPVNTPYTFTAKVQDNSGNPIASQAVTFTVLSGPNAGKTGTATTDANGDATFTYTGTVASTVPDTVQASFTDPNCTPVNATSNQATVTWTGSPPAPTTLKVNPATGDFADATTVSAVLTNTATSAPVSGEPVAFKLNGTETCTGTTDGTGTASCSITPGEAAGTYTLAAAFAGDTTVTPNLMATTGSANFVVTLEQTALSYTGATSATNGQPVTLSGVLTTDDPSAGTALAGKGVTFTLGTGGGAQTCSATTDSTGTASCTIASVSQTGTSVAVAGSFAGDTFYLPASVSSSLSLTTGPQPTTIATTLMGGGQSGTSITVPENTAVTDTATVSGTNAASATGTVTYNVYPDSDCDESPVATSTVTVTAGSVPPSTAVSLSKSGTYNWTASYSGDTANAPSVSKCGSETEIVKGPESTRIKTKLLGGKVDDGVLLVPANTPVSDSATLSGDNVSSAGGTVTYTVYADPLCDHGSESSSSSSSSNSSCKPSVVSTDTVTVTDGVVPNSSPVSLSPGFYSWLASYSGDALNKPSTSEFGSETEIVFASKTKISTSLSGGGQTGSSITVPANTPVTDSATLSGANTATATGTVTYRVYSDRDCEESAGATSKVTVTAGSVPASSAVTLSKSRTYYWQASYSGDTNNAPSRSSCGSETETVKNS
jgi:hypothetical protein